jgi:hypothetical protein
MAKAHQAPPAVSAPKDALSALVRLLARQAAREWAASAQGGDLLQAALVGQEPRE